MNLRERALASWGQYKGWNPLQMQRFNAFADGVAAVESNGVPDIAQRGGGPGRGKYQYELQAGGSGANITARNRLRAFQQKIDPDFRLSDADQRILDGKDPDFSKISEDGQDALFIIDKALSALPTDAVANGELPPAEAWAQFHWAGDQSKKPQKIAQWNRSGAEQLVARNFPNEDPFASRAFLNNPAPQARPAPVQTQAAARPVPDVQEPAVFNFPVRDPNQYQPQQVAQAPTNLVSSLGSFGQSPTTATPAQNAVLNASIDHLFQTRPSAAQQLAAYGPRRRPVYS